jgi:hypothetical protein
LIKMLELISPNPDRAGSGALQWQLTAPTYVVDPRRDQVADPDVASRGVAHRADVNEVVIENGSKEAWA